MNKFSDEQLELVKGYAYDLLSWKDIAYLLEIPLPDFRLEFENPRSKLLIAYQSGRIKRKHELRKPILSMAAKGSPQAEILAVKFLEEQLFDESND